MSRHKKPCGLHCIKINNMSVTIGHQEIIRDINIHIHCGKLTVIIGQNGAGKSTFVKAVLNEIPHTGTIEFKDYGNLDINNLKIGYVPQSLNIERNTPASVYDLIAGFQTKHPVFLWKKKKIYEKIKNQLQIFMAADLIDKPVGKLSGGELQRVLLALATMDEPNLMILDEPVSGIDRNGIDLFYKTLEILKTDYDMAIILVSHDLEYVGKYADEVILLDKSILKKGSAGEVYTSNEFKEVFGNIQYEIPHITGQTEGGENQCRSSMD